MKVNGTQMIVTYFPAIIIFLISLVSFTTTHPNLKGLFIISLLVIFPLLYFIQRIVCSVFKVNFLYSLFISTMAFLIVLLVFLNSSAIIYIFMYIVTGILGYGLVKLAQELRNE
ncbi:hypothetical protein [Alkalihalobacterium alkalinitrilicum]|uniref:hypothetical protein n=1 Tax=Alkalihalobacterium alkalinitrilicum TaxID=427920 RepID=UPI00099596A6|nr:hypothetical protein [Alkalihalobacterium alkalinitrilicum]